MRNAMVMCLAVVCCTLVVGCPENACFLQICTNGVCHCPVNSCMEGADYDLATKTCVCVASRHSIGGQCLSQPAADAYCGANSTYAEGGCVKTACAAGQELDEGSGRCMNKAQVDQIAKGAGVDLAEGEKLGCPAGSKLVIEGETAGCVPLEQTCARDESWDGSTCAKRQQCPTGSDWDSAQGRCVEYAKMGDDAAEVNVAQWTQSNFGPNGGRGTSAFCNQFAGKPWRFGVPQGQTAMVQIGVQLSFPGGEIKGATVATAPSYVNNPTPVPASGVSSIQSAAESVLAPLKEGGGRATEAQASTVVKCAVVNAAKPLAVPATGGF